jgi:hypothetical protein
MTLISIVAISLLIVAILKYEPPTPAPRPAVAKVKSIETVHSNVILAGEDRVSEMGVDLDSAPPGWYYRFDGPKEAIAVFSDGVEGPISKDFGVKGGTVRFKGPVGQSVTVRFSKTPFTD